MAAVSTHRLRELLDYATVYGEFNEATPNGTTSDLGEPMDDARRDAIRWIKELLSYRAEADATMRGWSLIDTAPVGTPVDLWREGERLTDFTFDGSRWSKPVGWPVRIVVLTKPPTHWRPVPTAPTAVVALPAGNAA